MKKSGVIYGIGKRDKKVKDCSPYILQLWKNMLKRCYSVSYHLAQPTYSDCKVCDKWLIYSNFERWVLSQDNWQDKELDKDILSLGCKLYSEDTCMFVPQEINKLLTVKSISKEREFPIGVSYNSSTKLYHANCGMGSKGKTFNKAAKSAWEAYVLYLNSKMYYVKTLIGTHGEYIDGVLFSYLDYLEEELGYCNKTGNYRVGFFFEDYLEGLENK